ncbi:MAG: O-antigen ligase family protein [Clostridiales bacterium]|nr:O-antigen ligase family protein [Clostridiales bacterium]MDO4349701.1 O-antigen ligase family protein [Eubacteriales bacterium]MDY4008827.1 O-antigen ligase family protein [Candidatus Limiplasma sp.]
METIAKDAQRRLWRVRWITVLAAALVMVLNLLTYERAHALMQNCLSIPIYALLGVALYRADYAGDRVYRVGLAFVLWYAVTRILNGDHYLQYDYNQYRLVALCATYGLAFPLAGMLRDGQRRRALDCIALALVAVLAVCIWLGVIAALKGEIITIPFFNSEFGLKGGRLWILSQHPNLTAAVSLCGIFMLVYLLASHWRWWLLPPALAVGAGFFIALPLSDSRTGMVALLFGIVIAGAAALQRLPLPPKWRRLAGIACLACVVLVVAVAGFGAAVKLVSTAGESGQAVSQRSLLKDLPTLTGRTAAYAAVPTALSNDPLALLRGYDELEMMPAINRLTAAHFDHMHNSYLQTLMLTGAPGLLMALWLSLRVIGSALKLLFSSKATLSQKLLIPLPAALFLQGMLEHYLFVDSYSILNLLFFLFAGYVIELGRPIAWKLPFPLPSKRKQAN